mgnify:CR=1 FL=1
MPTFDHPTGKRVHLMNVYTNNAYRRQGIGKKMVALLIEEAKARSYTESALMRQSRDVFFTRREALWQAKVRWYWTWGKMKIAVFLDMCGCIKALKKIG